MKTAFFCALVITGLVGGQGRDFSPSEEFKASQRGEWTIEVPEVQELVHIIIAITPVGMDDRNMVQHQSDYYESVQTHFGLYRDHSVVKKVNRLLEKGRYARLKMDACGFYFNEQGRIEKDPTYKQLNWSEKNFVEPILEGLEDFSDKTGFREFFLEHQEYYNSLVSLMKAQMPVDNQWKWLEERFPEKYDNYRITFSPLTNGSHSTNRFETKDFRQTVMFVCGPIESNQLSDKVKEGLMTRIVFTEIDHNYVNPLTEKFEKQVGDVFKNRDKWTSGKDSEHYGSAIAIFNEYMTWAVFTLYAFDTFNESDFSTINERTEALMTERRGFQEFKEFNRELLELYRNHRPEEKLENLYPLILEWCGKH